MFAEHLKSVVRLNQQIFGGWYFGESESSKSKPQYFLMSSLGILFL